MNICTTFTLSLIALTPVSAQLRGLATCPTLDHVLDENGVTDGVSKWLTKADGASFIADLFIDYLTDETHSPLASVAGQYLLDGNFPVCQNLPLKADQCFIAANPDRSFFRHIVADKVPLGEHIIGAVEFVEDYIDEYQAEMDSFLNQFFLQEDTGTCIVGNDKVIGIYENPGFPNPAVYSMCNAITKFKTGNDGCAIQPYFKGFALSTSNSNSLVMTDQLPGDFYDGYARYKFAPQGDAFAAFDLKMKFPTSESASIGPDLSSTIRSFLAQPPARDVEIGGSLFVKNPTSADSELLYLLTIDEMKLNLNIGKQKFLSINFGNAFAAMRSNTANPSCQPSGIFLSANVEESSLGSLLAGFFDNFIPSVEVDVGLVMSDGASGVTSLDPLKTLGDIEAVFYRLQLDQVGFMGITVDNPTFEVQYLTGKEMQRRRSWNPSTCCSNANVLNDDNSCGVVQSPLTDFINSGVPEQTTLAMFFTIGRISFFGVVNFNDIAVQLYSQIPDDSSSVVATTLDMKCSVDVLSIAGADATVKFKVATDVDSHLTNIHGSFRVEATVDAKLVKMTLWVTGTADVTQFSYEQTPDRRLTTGTNRMLSERRLTLGGGSLSNADWDLDFGVEVESEVLDAVLDFAEDMVEEVYENIEKAWNEVEDFAGEQWDAVKGMAGEIGTPASDIVEAIDNAVGGAVDLAGDGLEALSDVLSDIPLDDHLAPAIGKAVGFVGDVLKKQAKAFVALGSGLFAGDISAIGNFALAPFKIAGLFGTSIRSKHMIDVPGQTDGEFGCTKKRWRFRKCKKYIFKTVCKWRHSDPFDNEDCVREGMQKKSRKLDNLRRLSAAAKDKVKCQKKSKHDNAGIKWFHDQKVARRRQLQGGRVLDASMSAIRKHVGHVSTMESNDCQKLKLKVGAKALRNSNDGGLESTRRFEDVETDGCVDLSNQDSLNAALSQLQTKSGEKIKELVLSESAGPDKCLTGGLTYIPAPKGKCKSLAGETKVRMPHNECRDFGGSTIGSITGPWVECQIDLCEEESGVANGEAIFAAGIDKCNPWGFVAQGSLDLHRDLCEQIGGIASPSAGGMFSECSLHWCKASQGTKDHLHFTFGGYGGTCKDRVGPAILETTKNHCDNIGGYYPYAYNEESPSTWLPCEVELCSNHHISIHYSETNPVTMIAAEKGRCNTLLGNGKFETSTGDCKKMGGIAGPEMKAVNVARDKPVTASSNHGSFPASLLTNGKMNDFAHTNMEDNPWFEIDLGGEYNVEHITVHNRKDGSEIARARANNFKLELSDASRKLVTFHGPDDMSNVDRADFDLFSEEYSLLLNNTLGFVARYVKVQLPTRDYLNLAEVEVFGEPWMGTDESKLKYGQRVKLYLPENNKIFLTGCRGASNYNTELRFGGKEIKDGNGDFWVKKGFRDEGIDYYALRKERSSTYSNHGECVRYGEPLILQNDYMDDRYLSFYAGNRHATTEPTANFFRGEDFPVRGPRLYWVFRSVDSGDDPLEGECVSRYKGIFIQNFKEKQYYLHGYYGPDEHNDGAAAAVTTPNDQKYFKWAIKRSGFSKCDLDWCDAKAGTETGKGYTVGGVGSCAEKAGSGIVHIPKHHCDEINGGTSINDLGAHQFMQVPCHVDWCVIEENKVGTTDGWSIVPGPIGGCADHFSYGPLDMDSSLCTTMGGLYEKYPDNQVREGCFLDWCRVTDEASILPGVSEGADLMKKILFPAFTEHCRYKAASLNTLVTGKVCAALNKATCGETSRGDGVCADGRCCSQHGWCGVTSAHCGETPVSAPRDCHIDWCYANNGAGDGPSDVLGDAMSLVLTSTDNCNKDVGSGVFIMFQSDCKAIGGEPSSNVPAPYDSCSLRYCDAEAGTKDGRGFLPAAPGACDALGIKKVATIQTATQQCQNIGGVENHGSPNPCYLDFCQVDAPNTADFADEELLTSPK